MKNIDNRLTYTPMGGVSGEAVDIKDGIQGGGISPYLKVGSTPPFGGGDTLGRLVRLVRAWWAGVNNATHPPQSSPLARPWFQKRATWPALIEYRITYPMVTFKSLENKEQFGACCQRVASTPLESRPN